MKRQPSGGRSFVRAVRLLWLGFIAGSSAAPVITNRAAARAIAAADEYDQLIAEIFYGEELPKLERRLAFEAWADSR